MPFPTPNVASNPEVYDPAEDSYLLIDALESDLNPEASSSILVELGSGSGIVSTFIQKYFRNFHVISVDINPIACEISLETSRKNGCYIDAILSSLLTSIRGNLIDYVVFNPPYVVTPSEEVGKKGITASWAGGINGREVIDQFINQCVKNQC